MTAALADTVPPPAAVVARAAAPAAAPVATAIVDAAYAGRDGAVVGGAPTFHTLGAALAAAPATPGPYLVRLRAGRYREKRSIDRADVWLEGAGRTTTVLTWDDAAGTAAHGGVLGTRGSWTLRVTAPGFRAAHLTVENAFDYDANAHKRDGDPGRLHDTQGLALALVDRSDRAVLDDVRLLGHQDTFFANVGRTYVHGTEIAGNVDFIFGAGRVVFDSCDVVSLDRGSPTDNGYVTAPSTDAATPVGFLFVRSRLKKERPSMAPNSVVLGRPWHPSATPLAVSSAVFVDCWMDDHVGARGWDRMSSVDSATRVRYWFEPASARFFEYHSTGPGAVASPTRRVLGEGDVRSYSVARVLGDWAPEVTK